MAGGKMRIKIFCDADMDKLENRINEFIKEKRIIHITHCEAHGSLIIQSAITIWYEEIEKPDINIEAPPNISVTEGYEPPKEKK